MNNKSSLDQVPSQYLIFEIGTHRYASPLSDLCEIIERPEFCRVPNSILGFMGITNLRGELIACVDLSQRFEVQQDDPKDGKLIITFNDGLKMGALVDRIISVQTIDPADIDYETAVRTGIDAEYLLGIYKGSTPPVIIIHLARLLSERELIQVEELSKKIEEAV